MQGSCKFGCGYMSLDQCSFCTSPGLHPIYTLHFWTAGWKRNWLVKKRQWAQGFACEGKMRHRQKMELWCSIWLFFTPRSVIVSAFSSLIFYGKYIFLFNVFPASGIHGFGKPVLCCVELNGIEWIVKPNIVWKDLKNVFFRPQFILPHIVWHK